MPLIHCYVREDLARVIDNRNGTLYEMLRERFGEALDWIRNEEEVELREFFTQGGSQNSEHLIIEVEFGPDMLPRAEELHGLSELVTPEGDLRSLPCHLAELGGMDGFYACRLRRQ